LIIEKCLVNKKNNNYFNEILLFCRIKNSKFEGKKLKVPISIKMNLFLIDNFLFNLGKKKLLIKI
jgi:hypothetical protein